VSDFFIGADNSVRLAPRWAVVKTSGICNVVPDGRTCTAVATAT
jgi:hypothetical protein